MERYYRAILITAATKRLGFALAKQSLAMGYSVVAHYRSSKTVLARWLRTKPEYQKRVHFIKADLRYQSEGLFDKAFALPVSLIGLINNASVFSCGNLNDFSHFGEIYKVNVEAPLRLSLQFYRRVKKGWIINMTDAHVSGMDKRHQNYRISKNILNELTSQLAFLCAPRIRVNAIAPGAVLPPPKSQEGYFSKLRKYIPLERTSSVTDICKAYTYIVENRSVTGQILYVDGGWHLSR